MTAVRRIPIACIMGMRLVVDIFEILYLSPYLVELSFLGEISKSNEYYLIGEIKSLPEESYTRL